jgi:5-methylcytosine-specific restriction enzyme B
MTTTPATDPFTTAAALIRERVLVRGTSLLRARDRLWRQPALDRLVTRVRAAAAADGGSVHERWHAALDGAGEDVVRLAAEGLAVHVLIAADLRAATKRRLLTETLAHLRDPPPLPAALDAALGCGPTPTGVAFKRRRLSQVGFVLAAAGAWRALPPADRRDGLGDPWAFRDWLRTVPVDGAHAQREALLHLAHPATFEPITSAAAKARIVAALGRAGERSLGDPDAALLAIRARLTPRHGEGFSFAAPPLVDRWLA